MLKEIFEVKKMKKLSKKEKFYIIITVIIGILLGILLAFFYGKSAVTESTQKTKLDLKLNDSSITLNLPMKDALSSTQNPILVYNEEKTENGTIEVYTQQKSYEKIKDINKMGIILKDETMITFELYNTEDKEPLRIIEQSKEMISKNHTFEYGKLKASNTQVNYYCTTKISETKSLLITINAKRDLTETDLMKILKYVN